jgi:integrase
MLADPDAVARKLMEPAHALGMVKMLRICTEQIEGPFPFDLKRAQDRAGGYLRRLRGHRQICRRTKGVSRPKFFRSTEAEYRTLGEMLRAAGQDEKYTTTADIIRRIALTGCRRSEIIGLKWSEVGAETSCLRLADSKEGASIRLL